MANRQQVQPLPNEHQRTAHSHSHLAHHLNHQTLAQQTSHHQYEDAFTQRVDPQLQHDSNSLHSVSPPGFRPLPPRSQCTSTTTTTTVDGPTLQSTHLIGPGAINSASPPFAQQYNQQHLHSLPVHRQDQRHYQQQAIPSPAFPLFPTETDYLQAAQQQQHHQQQQHLRAFQQQQQQQQQQRQQLYIQAHHQQRQIQQQQHLQDAAHRSMHAPLRPMPSGPSTQQHLTRLSPESPLLDTTGLLDSSGRLLLPSGGSAVSSPSPEAESSTSASGRARSAPRRNGHGVGYVPGATTNVTPQKDEEGKFPCQNCHKTYLHAKHLKRHMLRHTGDRPYTCGLCNDNFSRSDILKRHFQKCSARRGNPLGVTHLTLTHAQQKLRQAEKEREKQAAAAAAQGASSKAQLSGSESKKASGKSCDGCVKLKVKCNLGQPCSRCNSKDIPCTYTKHHLQSRRDSSTDDNDPYSIYRGDVLDEATGHGKEFRFPPVTHPNAHMAGSAHAQTLPINQNIRLDQQIPASTSIGVLPGLELNQHSPQSQSLFDTTEHGGNATGDGTSSSGPVGTTSTTGSDAVDWQRLLETPFTTDPNQFFSHTQPVLQSGNNDNTIGEGIDSLLFNFPPNQYRPLESSTHTFWSPDHHHDTYSHQLLLQDKCDSLISFIFDHPAVSPLSGRTQPADSNEDLKAWLTPQHLEHFIQLFFHHFEAHFPIIHVPTFDIRSAHIGLLSVLLLIGAVYSPRGITVSQVRRLTDHVFLSMTHRVSAPAAVELEDIQALLLLHVLMTWHGTSSQRHLARTRYSFVLDLAKRINLFRPLTAAELRTEISRPGQKYYRLPVSDLEFSPLGSASFSWSSWISQERRYRCAHVLYLLSTAFLIYFNSPPKLPTSDLDIPLPSDDAPWEATDATTCAAALGCYGDSRARGVNLHGTRMPTQMRFLDALKELLHPHCTPLKSSTNAFSKFILVHALHIQLWLYQAGGSWAKQALWPRYINGKEALGGAFRKWGKCWKEDLGVQYPGIEIEQRKGFGRDGEVYAKLGLLMLGMEDRGAMGYEGDGDDEGARRNMRVTLGLLGRCRGDRREEKGIDIDGSYGVEELCFDMKLLFKPIE
ncbi:fungal-specific transcription factor domain-containing protein [Pyronema domesticum]|uniref:Similar to Regulatory protein ADR1 acc. no. P07248 n=1 Tax=Pyronema omphalodes (strain CBS 100304) TaxID=1076935 RepID=U4LNZ0_PYROM|nr:fungal-specific transcription factor domain-containing protein [Pyronema domesticum]CCX16304.1 Similar to Regulatory protein ADR1; acc. no. P07248 [Pyronema omphalodes CBS 100304]